MVEGVVLYILEKLLGNVSENVGEKAVERLSNLGVKKFRQLVNRKQLDFLSSNEDFERARAELERIQRAYRDIFHKIDEMYHPIAWSPDEFGVFRPDQLTLISAKLAEIQREQERIGDVLEELSRNYPSIPILIGKFMTDFQDAIELLTISHPTVKLDRQLIFATYVPRVITTRADLIYAAKESVDRNLGAFKKAVSGGSVDADTLVQMRTYERLSYVMDTAVGSTLAFMGNVKNGAEIPKAVEAISNVLRALRLRTERLRELKAGPLSDDLPKVAFSEAWKDIREALKILSSDTTGPMGERIATANKKAKKAIKLIQNST